MEIIKKKINWKQSNKSVERINNERTLVQFSTVLRQKVIVSTGSKGFQRPANK